VSKTGKHKYKAIKFFDVKHTILYRACRYCNYIEFSKFDVVAGKRYILPAEVIIDPRLENKSSETEKPNDNC
jgi:predicted nucleic-acid-binding Zn-ribbon protein